MSTVAEAPDAESLSVDEEPSRLFYGWVMVGLATLVMLASTPGQTFGVAFFNEHFRAVCGLSTTGIAAVYLTATVLASLAVPYLGGLSDRLGLRRTILIAVAAMAVLCLLGSAVSNVAMLFAFYLLMRSVGPGWLTLLANNTVANWFDRRLGVASGAMQLGMAGSIAVVPSGIATLIDQFGWRGAYVALAAGIAAVLVPLVLLFYREVPHEVGEVRDGRRASLARLRKRGVEADPHPSRGYTLSEARTTHAYWMLLLAAATWAGIGTGLIFHINALFGELGLSTDEAKIALTVLACGMAAMQVLGGLLADRLPGRLMLAAAVAAIAATCFSMAGLGKPGAFVGYALFGLGQGTMTVIVGTIWPRYFGRTHLGKIRGTSLTAAIAGSSLGPLVMGVSADYLGGFTPSLWAMGLFAAAVCVASLTAANPGPIEA
ncbi:MAG: MFS transporter [Planctomycetota bacterium]